tara:strand:- start:8 stop:319 length:312 start_codon:yes stop_codon:yes gene_type:complete
MGIQINGQTDTISASDGSLSTNDLTINNLTGVAATFTGVLTYEDVTSIDSIGIVTARSGVLVGSGQSYGSVDGDTAVYYGDGSNLQNLPASGDSNDITASLFL